MQDRRIGRPFLALGVLALLHACGKDSDAWLQDLDAGEPFARVLAAAALREAPERDHPRVVHALLRTLIDEDASVRDQVEGSLRQLAARSPACSSICCRSRSSPSTTSGW